MGTEEIIKIKKEYEEALSEYQKEHLCNNNKCNSRNRIGICYCYEITGEYPEYTNERKEEDI